MCGINGFLYFKNAQTTRERNAEELREMNAKIRHRTKIAFKLGRVPSFCGQFLSVYSRALRNRLEIKWGG